MISGVREIGDAGSEVFLIAFGTRTSCGGGSFRGRRTTGGGFGGSSVFWNIGVFRGDPPLCRGLGENLSSQAFVLETASNSTLCEREMRLLLGSSALSWVSYTLGRGLTL